MFIAIGANGLDWQRGEYRARFGFQIRPALAKHSQGRLLEVGLDQPAVIQEPFGHVDASVQHVDGDGDSGQIVFLEFAFWPPSGRGSRG
jgi:hypothetical protein